MASIMPVVAVRGSTGIYLSHGPPNYDNVSAFTRDDSKTCRAMAFSKEGDYFAWVNGISLNITDNKTWHVITEIPKPKTSYLLFSPKNTYIVTWEQFQTTTDNPQGVPNLCFWEVKTGKLVKAVAHKKQSDWQPQWSDDERICGRIVNQEVGFYHDHNFDTPSQKMNIQKISDYSLAPGPPPYHLLCYVTGDQGQPSFGRLFEYPKFESSQAIANKSFFQADHVEIKWNNRGTGVLLMTTLEVDKTGSSYYGKQALHYMDTKKETALVQLSKDGPIYSVEWSPKGTEFCCVYGFVPAKATIFNVKCEIVFDFGTGPRNAAFYNIHGNMLILGGFGNISGNFEVWNLKAKNLIQKVEALNTTDLKWSPDGEHVLTATTAPRLREGNGFKIWHYTGSLLYERPWNKMEELWEVLWQQLPEGIFKETSISYKPVEGILPTLPQASTLPYRPPGARGRPSTFKLHEDDELPSNQKGDANLTKTALRNKKHREAKKAKKEEEEPNGEIEKEPDVIPIAAATAPVIGSELTGDPDRDKKIKNINKKLEQIQKLKNQQKSGKQLEINQLDKLKKEDELLSELKELSL